MNKKTIIATIENKMRLDKFLVNEITLSREKIKKLINKQKILVNNHSVKPNYNLIDQDKISIEFLPINSNNIVAQKLELNIVFEDEQLIVINKGNNIVVHPGPGNKDKTLVNGLLWHCKQLSNIGGAQRLGVVHRIDKKTTGLLVFAKNDQTHLFLTNQFANKTSKRTYYALVWGIIGPESGTIKAPIGRSQNNRKIMTVTELNSKIAITHFKVIQRFSNYTYLKLNLETGRTHQIRVHMNYINHPIVGDKIYGKKKNNEEFGQYLHAKTLAFIHPQSQLEVTFDSELPKEFLKKLSSLK